MLSGETKTTTFIRNYLIPSDDDLNVRLVSEVIRHKALISDNRSPLTKKCLIRIGIHIQLYPDICKSCSLRRITTQQPTRVQISLNIDFERFDLDIQLVRNYISHDIQTTCERCQCIFNRICRFIPVPKAGGSSIVI